LYNCYTIHYFVKNDEIFLIQLNPILLQIKMSVKFQLEHRTIEVPYDTAIGSDYIKHTIEDTNTNLILIPDKYSTLIFNYIDFLTGNESLITNKNYLRDCFLHVYLLRRSQLL